MIGNANLLSEGRQNPRQQTQERGLARAIRADDARHASHRKLHRDVLERVSTVYSFTEGLAQVFDDDCVHISLSRKDARRLHGEGYCSAELRPWPAYPGVSDGPGCRHTRAPDRQAASATASSLRSSA